MRLSAFPISISVAMIAATPALAASPFDGTWRADPKATKFDPKPDMRVIKDGVYTCSTCTPALTVAADGKINPVAGRDYADAMQVTVVDDRTVKMASFKKGQMYSEQTMTLSPDNAMVTMNWRNNNNPQNKWLSGSGSAKRTGPAPAGAHALSGAWVPVVSDADKIPEEQMVATMSVVGKTYKWSTPLGSSFTGTLGGAAVPIVGNKAGVMVAVKRLSPNSLEATYSLKGTPIAVDTMTVTDPKTMTIAGKDLRAGFVDTTVLRKQ